jgi:nicotinamide mononucleotide transporter
MTYTDSDVPYWDSFTTVFSFIATWMMARRYLGNWLIWIFIDAICVGIYIYKGLKPTAGLFMIYTVMAIYGYYSWSNSVIKENEQST